MRLRSLCVPRLWRRTHRSLSCKTRFRPSCGKVRTDEWVNCIAQELLDVPHLHLTLTIAQDLRPYFAHYRDLLKLLLTVTAEAVCQVIAEWYPGVQIGIVYTVHTFGRDLEFKPHVHLVIAKGGLKDGRWAEIEGVPGGKLSAKWRYLLCNHMRQLFPHDHRLQAIIDQLYRKHRGFQIYTEGLAAATYIGRYLGHPPLATSRLTQYDGQQVHFWYRDTETGLRRELMLSPLEFISLLVQHISPKGMQLMRHAGLYARNVKAEWAAIAHAALDVLRRQIALFALEAFTKVYQRLTWQERFKASFGRDPLACPKCQTTMQLAEIWEPQRGHIWMKQWLDTQRMRKAARLALEQVRAARSALSAQYRQLAFAFDTS